MRANHPAIEAFFDTTLGTDSDNSIVVPGIRSCELHFGTARNDDFTASKQVRVKRVSARTQQQDSGRDDDGHYHGQPRIEHIVGRGRKIGETHGDSAETCDGNSDRRDKSYQ